MSIALLLIAHGSREPQANEDLQQLATALRQQGEFNIVVPAFLEIAEPTILQGVARCVQEGAKQVVMVPYFLSAGVHVRQDLTTWREKLAGQFAGVEFRLAQPLGRHPALLELVSARAKEALAKSKS